MSLSTTVGGGKSGGVESLGSSAVFSEYGNNMSQERSTVSPTDAAGPVTNTGSNAWKSSSSSQHPSNSLRHFGLPSPSYPLSQWQSNFDQPHTQPQQSQPPLPTPSQSYHTSQYQYSNPILPLPYPQPSFSTNPSHHALPRIRTSPNHPPPQSNTNAFGETIYNPTTHSQSQPHHPNTHYGLLSPYHNQGHGGYAYSPPQYQYPQYPNTTTPYHHAPPTPTNNHIAYLYSPNDTHHNTGPYPGTGNRNTIQPSTFFSNTNGSGSGLRGINANTHVNTISGSMLGTPVKEGPWGEEGRRGSEISDGGTGIGIKEEYGVKVENMGGGGGGGDMGSGGKGVGENDPYRRDPPRECDAVRYTDDSECKQSDLLKRFCTNCKDIKPPSWRKSVVKPGKILCNKCGIYERTHHRPRPISTIDGAMIRRPPKIILRTGGGHVTATVKKRDDRRTVSGGSGGSRLTRAVEEDDEDGLEDGQGDVDDSPDESNYSSTMSQPTPLTAQTFPLHTSHVASPLTQPLRRASIAISGTTHSQPFSPMQTPPQGRLPHSSSTLPTRQTRRRGDSSPYGHGHMNRGGLVHSSGRAGVTEFGMGGTGVGVGGGGGGDGGVAYGMSVGGLAGYAISNSHNGTLENGVGSGGLPGWRMDGGAYGFRKGGASGMDGSGERQSEGSG